MNPLSRGRFLEESILAATAALSAPSISVAAESKQSSSPNERLAVIGTGSRGGHLSAGLCHLGNISWLLGRKASTDKIAKQLQQRKLHDDSGDTLRRTCQHLNANNVDLAKTRLTLGPWLKFDPKKERFIDNEPANAMLTRKYRRPFTLPTPTEV